MRFDGTKATVFELGRFANFLEKRGEELHYKRSWNHEKQNWEIQCFVHRVEIY